MFNKPQESEQLKGLAESPWYKEWLESQVGVSLNIGNGSGQSKDDPIKVLDASDFAASRTEFLVLYSKCKIRNVLWRTLNVQFVPGTDVIQRKIETKEVNEDRIVTQLESFYFIRPNFHADNNHIFGEYFVYGDTNIGIGLPFELSWLHAHGMTDYREQGRSDLGYGLEYGAPGIKANLYVYPCGHVDNKQDILALELQTALSQIRMVCGTEEISFDWEGPRRNEESIVYCYIPKSEESNVSALVIATTGSFFVKLRCTFVDEPLMRDVFSRVLAEFHALVPVRHKRKAVALDLLLRTPRLRS